MQRNSKGIIGGRRGNGPWCPVRPGTAGRPGAATLDYVLLLGVVLPILAIVIPQGRRMMQLVFEMTAALVSWPFM